MAKKGSNRQDRLAALRAKLQQVDTGGGRGGFWKPKEGRSLIRILPEVGEMEFFFQTVGVHYLPNRQRVYCPRFTSHADLDPPLPCPFCEIVGELYNAGDDASKALAGKISRSKQYWMNIIVRDQEDLGPQIFTPGAMIMGKITALVNDPDYGDIYDVQSGVDITILREGTTRHNTNYDALARRESSPLHDDPDVVDDWLDRAADLSWVEVSMDPAEDRELSKGHAVYVLPYDRIVEEFDLEAIVEQGMEDLDEEFSDEDEEEDFQEEDDEFEEEEDDEEEEDEVRREVKVRRARRSRRRSR